MLIKDEIKLIQEKPIVGKLLCGLFVLLLIIQISNIVHSLLTINNKPMANPANDFANKEVSRKDILQGLKVELFGKYIPKQLGDANIRPSILDLHVIGILYAKDKHNSKVILRFANGIERSYKIGDIIPGGAKILHISKDGVVVRRDGTLERLSLPKDKLKFEKALQPLN